MKISTSDLMSALSLLGNGVDKKNINDITTQMVELSVDNGALYGYTSDKTNYLKVKICDTTDDLLAVVDYNTLYNLIKVVRADDINLKADAKVLTLKSTDLNCKLPILLDSMGNIVKLSTFWSSVTKPSTYDTINFSTLKTYLSTIKSVIVDNFIIPCYSCVYFDKDFIMASDTDNVIKIEEGYFNDIVLLKMSTVEFLAKLEEVDCKIDNDKMFINTDNIEFITKLQDKSEYQADDLNGLFTVQMDSNTVISGDDFNTAIATSKLFNYPTVQLQFSDSGTYFKIPQNDFSYRISTTKTDDFTYTLTNEITNKLLIAKGDLTVYYGTPELIKVISDNISGIFGISA